MAKILVTGGAGYIGSILTRDLLTDGHEVTVLDNFLYRQNSLATEFINRNLNVIVGDVRDYPLIRSVLPKFDIIVPLAAIVGAPACSRDPIAAESINLSSAITLIEETSKNQLIIMPTTNSAYGTTPEGSLSSEESELNPISIYAEHKVEVERKLLQKGNGISFRLATVFGMSPRMRLDLLVNDMVYRALHEKSVVLFEPNFVRNYVHVRDVSRGIRWAINKQEMKGHAFNFGHPEGNLSKLQLCELIARKIPGFTFPTSEFGKDPDQRNYFVSNDKILKTGFQFSVSLEDGVSELIAGLKTINRNLFSNL